MVVPEMEMRERQLADELALAGAFAAAVDEDSRRRVGALPRTRPQSAALTELIGVINDDALAELRALALPPMTLAALTLVPVLLVAWRSALPLARKREAVREAAATLSLRPEDTGHALLSAACTAGNGDDIARHWKSLVHQIVAMLPSSSLSALQWGLMDRAWLMATSLHGADASGWGSEVFSALTELENAFYERPRAKVT